MYIKNRLVKTAKILVYCLFVSVLLNCEKSRDIEKIVIPFVNALLNDSLKAEALAERYLMYENKLDLFKLQVAFLREKSRTEGIEINDLKIVDLEDASEKLTGLQISEEERDQVFVVLYKGELLFPIKIRENKVESISVMNKGGRRFFMTF